jgi:hypothetical protein
MSIGLLIGTVLHAANSIRKINKNNPNVSLSQVFHQYIQNDKIALLTSIACSLALLWVSSEWVNLSHLEASDKAEPLKEKLYHFKLAQFIKTTSVVAGYFSDYIVYGWLGKTKGIIADKFKKSEPDKP